MLPSIALARVPKRKQLMRIGTFIWIAVSLLATTCLYAAGVTVVFVPSDPASGPYPSDSLTVADSAQKTGRRVNLPASDCAADRFGCILQPALNRLDGFNPQPRIRVRFSSAVNPATLPNGIFFVALDNLTADEIGLNKTGDTIRINEVVYDPATLTAFAKPDSSLDQHRRYALVVTIAVKDAAGDAVAAAPAYVACQANPTQAGCPQAADMAVIARAGISSSSVAAATVFTTASATAWLERARDALAATDPAFKAGPVVDLASNPVAVWHQQTGTDSFTDSALPFAILQGISRIAFATYASPNYLNAGQTIDMPGTAAALAPATHTEQIQFNVFLPNSPKPARGYPVVIFGHGFSSDRFSSPLAVASTFAAAGYAVLGIDAVGHGFGPRSSVTFSGAKGQLEVPAPGRGISQSSSGAIAAGDGCQILIPLPVGGRDCIQQTTVDLMQLARTLRAGVDLDGDGSVDLDGSRMAYVGHSLGGQYGTTFSAVDPSIPVAALAGAAGTNTTITRMSPSFIPSLAQYLGAVAPTLLNAGSTFDGNWPLRNEPVRVNDVKGAIEVQEAFEKVEWLSTAGEGLYFAPHLKLSPLAGVPAKKVLWQFPIGDRTNPNPTETAMVRAAGMQDSTRVYRTDLAYAANPAVPINPHTILLDVGNAVNAPVALAAQAQVAGFVASGGASIPDPSASVAKVFNVPNLFEAPSTLPETLNFLAFQLPALTSLSISSAAAGGPGFTFTLTGTGFASGSTVLWNGRSRTTSFSSATRLTATIPASDLATAGTAPVTVVNPTPGGGTSNALTFTITTGAFTPAPAISSGGVVNAAASATQLAVAGSIASVFGSNFTDSTVAATSLPLPATLAGVTVQINGLAVPLFAVSSQQINFQVPWYLQGQSQVTITILANGMVSNPVKTPLAPYSPGLFSTNQQGTGQGVVAIGNTGVIAAPLGMFPGSRPVNRGETVVVYCTGLGPVAAQPLTGSASAASVGATTSTTPTATIGGVAATVSFSGLAPTLVGVYQVNIVVPTDTPVSDAVPLVLSIGGLDSNKVTIAVR